jgi:hypothetical protein
MLQHGFPPLFAAKNQLRKFVNQVVPELSSCTAEWAGARAAQIDNLPAHQAADRRSVASRTTLLEVQQDRV